MATGRMLQRKISKSHDVAALVDRVGASMGREHGAYAALLFTWCIAHLDVEGRMHGDPRLVRGEVFPLLDQVSVSDVEFYLNAMNELRLVLWYKRDGRQWLLFPGFAISQPYLRKDREPESLVPPPQTSGNDPADCRHDAGVMTGEEKRREENIKELIPNSASPQGSTFDFEAVYSAYPRKLGRKKGMQRCKTQIRTREKYDALLRAVANYRAKIAKDGVEERFIKQFDTFMNCWEDYLVLPASASPARLPILTTESIRAKLMPKEDDENVAS